MTYGNIFRTFFIFSYDFFTFLITFVGNETRLWKLYSQKTELKTSLAGKE